MKKNFKMVMINAISKILIQATLITTNIVLLHGYGEEEILLLSEKSCNDMENFKNTLGARENSNVIMQISSSKNKKQMIFYLAKALTNDCNDFSKGYRQINLDML